jgi:tetratricopeptide (TPR) repeat protein
MLPGNRRKPTINPTSVEAALNTLVYTTTDTSDAATLLSLVLIEEYLHDPARPPAKNLREFALKSILCGLIEQTLLQFRTASELPALNAADTLSMALKQIQLDSQQNSADLLGWSYLYYRFVRIDMGISHDAYAEYANIETRSLRRYKKYIVTRLAEKLIDAEWTARRRQHQTRLLVVIPTDSHRPLIGREQQLQNAFAMLKDGLATRCYVTGGVGMGKTAFLAMLARLLTEAEMLDYVIWVSSPRTVEDVLNRLAETVLPPHSRLELRDMLVNYRVLLIIDDVAELSQNATDFSALLDFLAPCLVCMASEKHISLKQTVHHIHLDELNKHEVHELVQFLKADTTIPYSVSESICQEVGGNPQAIHLAVLAHSTGNQLTYLADSSSNMYAALFDSLYRAQQQVWILAAAMKDRQLHTQIIDMGMQQGLFSRDDVAHLLKAFIIQTGAARDFFTVSQSVQVFALHHRKFQTLIEPLVSVILGKSHELSARILHHFCLQLLRNAVPIFGNLRMLEIIHAGWMANEQLHHLNEWEAVFNKYQAIVAENYEISLAHAVCLRQLNQLEAAQRILETLIAKTGKHGNFSTQAFVLLELAILYRKQGQYTVAQECLTRSKEIEQQYPDKSLYARIIVEYAQIEIERQRPIEALKWLEQMETTGLNTKLMKAEVLFLLSRLKECQHVAYQTLPDLQNAHDFVRLVSLYTMLARSYQQQGDAEKATDCYNAALSYAEQQADTYAIARLKSNLATVLIHQNDVVAAEQLLIEAEETQRNIPDKIGLEVTHHNLQHLKQIKAKLS